MKIIETVEDVDERILKDAESTLEWFDEDERIDWEDFIDRLAKAGNSSDPPYDFESYDNPAIRKIQRHIRELRAS